jgi:flagellar basal-body rod protein FlgF
VSGTISMIEATMRADAEAVRVIGHNIANAQVAGYRRQIPVNSLSSTFAIAADEATVNAQATEMSAPATHVATDLRAGTLKSTGRPLDVALEGSGYLVLQGPSGPLLTRRGDLQVSAQGMLTSASGEAVLGEQGPIEIGTDIPVIDADGSVRVNDQVLDRLQVVQVTNEAALQYLGNGLFDGAEAAGIVVQEQSLLRQGFLEASNISPVGEMVQMMEAMRRFEGAQRLVRGYDQMMEKAISELGKVD